jgi:PTH1 family peptidyl-tRNA hydrolase
VKVIVGLGNPGKKYEKTRHNLGFMVVDRLAFANEIVLNKKKHYSLVASWRAGGEEALLVKPRTYMNRSGAAVRSLCNELGLKAEDFIVIHDDLDLPLKHIRIRQRGGAGGHRGVLSVLEALESQNFLRVRIGVGRPPRGVDATEYVLEPFWAQEEVFLTDMVSHAAEAVETLLESGPLRAMERFNREG